MKMTKLEQPKKKEEEKNERTKDQAAQISIWKSRRLVMLRYTVFAIDVSNRNFSGFHNQSVWNEEKGVEARVEAATVGVISTSSESQKIPT